MVSGSSRPATAIPENNPVLARLKTRAAFFSILPLSRDLPNAKINDHR